MAKHASIYPAPEELEAVQTLVSTVEGALKKVSDWMDGLNKASGKTSTNNEAGDKTVEEEAAEPKYVPLSHLPSCILALITQPWTPTAQDEGSFYCIAFNFSFPHRRVRWFPLICVLLQILIK